MLKISDSLSLPVEAVTQTFAVLAKRGAGKSYTGCVMVEEMLSANQQVIIADPVGVWWGLRSSADGKSPGFKIVVFGGEHGDLPLEEHAGEIVAQSIIENGFSAVLDLSLFRKAAQVRFMTAFAETLYRLNRKPLHFMVDEADEFAPQRPMHGAERLLGAFEDIVRRGRARGLGVTLITQRAAVLNKNVLTQIEVLVVLRTISPQDRAAIEAWTEIHGTEKQLAQLSETMASLPIGTAWFWSPGWLDVFKKIVVRKKTTFDSSATPKVGEKVSAPKALAEVNLEELGEQIKATAASAKANDPTELKKQLAAAKKEISVLTNDIQKQKSPPIVCQKDIQKVPALTDAERKRLTKLIEAFEYFAKTLDAQTEILNLIRQDMKTPAGVHTEIKFFRELLAGKLTPHAKFIPAAKPMVKLPVQVICRPTAAPPTALGSGDGGETAIGKCERAIMSALAQYPQGRSAVQVALRSEYSVNSGGFNNSLGKLRSLGFITRTQPIQITQEGLTALGDFDPLPVGVELAQHWIAKLPKCEAAILKFLVHNHPNEFLSQAVADEVGYSANSGGFNNSLGRLRTLELITRGQPMKASDEFFQ